ncbi:MULTISPECIES: aldo/keto reductase [unclassified Arthrobacter]|uniref:aldo/keto reductase n=1 Tax=unclassified Arthrobacter TaxID=235627 RepID=UPI001D137C17|nr:MULTISPECIES: aldo/keto reductase [unclassified Arthrobacter]MCC3274847.1 aldo/keto reductase [Arthrobacter sp. zg-Y20]MCC3279182.1 aldo/keto reductase [Arthrobacter sp. zg-Y40]MCC9177559.1 aldo/keto reductase [Arthrobacter sp. zg-Y750]MDK1315003.1 aldo/keto reductase [Arthrobacter sp. zg.Y20]WIB04854.1 aldo/keto reductase [Arthrobacter sp. zg-Y20]
MQPAPRIELNNGVLMDQIGFGTYKVPEDSAAGLCLTAFDTGYRHVDTAALYGNETGVGEAVNTFTDSGSAARGDIFVTSKVWNTDQGYDSTLQAFDDSLARLGLDYLDLYLIHWPCPRRGLFIETYRALESLYASGRVRAIGVSNFQPAHLEQLMDATGIVPAVNQIELHPWLAQQELRELHEQLGIRTVAWSPLGRGAVLADPVIGQIAGELGRTPAQVILRWHLDQGNVVIPKASSPERIAGNLDLFSFELTDAHRQAINGLDRGQRSGSHPDEVN